MARVFLSFSKSEQSQLVAQNLQSELEKFGHEFVADKTTDRGINLEKLKQSDVLLLLLEKDTVASEWIQREVDMALGADIAVLPLLIESEKISETKTSKLMSASDNQFLHYQNGKNIPQIAEAISGLAALTHEKRQLLISQAQLGQMTQSIIKQYVKTVENISAKSSNIPTAIFGTPLKSPKFQCDIFMVMPFRPHLDPVYTDHIKAVVKGLDLKILRGDDPFSENDIMHEVWSMINNASLVIADCTERNPNVFYELGIAHTLGKPAIMITQDIEDIPFDVRGKRAIVYDYTPRGMKEFEERLRSAIENILE